MPSVQQKTLTVESVQENTSNSGQCPAKYMTVANNQQNMAIVSVQQNIPQRVDGVRQTVDTTNQRLPQTLRDAL
jgi:hypothetical protein